MAENDAATHENKVALCGKANVGKTSIFYRIRDNTFVELDMRTQGIQFCDVSVHDKDGRSVEICLWDTLGMERYDSLTRSHYSGCKIVLLVYDCDDMDSLELLKDVYDAAVTHAPEAKMVLVRNKIDQQLQTVDADEAVEKLRTCDQGQRHRKLACHMATSAKTGDGINELRVELGNLLYNTEPVARNRGFSLVENEGHQPTQTVQDHNPQLHRKSCC